jgi:hypothetical protein
MQRAAVDRNSQVLVGISCTHVRMIRKGTCKVECHSLAVPVEPTAVWLRAVAVRAAPPIHRR